MLFIKDYTGKAKSIYICDRCGEIINNEEQKRYKLHIDTYRSPTISILKTIKKYDLCKKCITPIIKFIEKGKDK